MGLLDLTTRDLLDAFASSAPVPGGGSAAALAGAVGASLLLMVARLPKTRSGTDAERVALEHQAAALASLRQRLTSLVEEDSAAYERVMGAFRLPRTTDDEKTARKTAIQAATREATEAPLAVMRACAEALTSAHGVAAHGNRNAASDVRVGIALLEAGCSGAHENIAINLPGLTDAGLREAIAASAREAFDVASGAAEAARDALDD